MDKDSLQTLLYVMCYIVGLVLGFFVLSISALFTATGILYGIAYLNKINM